MFEARFIKFYLDRIEAAWPKRTDHNTRKIVSYAARDAETYLKQTLPGQFSEFVSALYLMGHEGLHTQELVHGGAAYQHGLNINWTAVEQDQNLVIEPQPIEGGGGIAPVTGFVPRTTDPVTTTPTEEPKTIQDTANELARSTTYLITDDPADGIAASEEEVYETTTSIVPSATDPSGEGDTTAPPDEQSRQPWLDTVTLANIFRDADRLLRTSPDEGRKLAARLHDYLALTHQSHPRLVQLLRAAALSTSNTEITAIRNDGDWVYVVQSGDLYLGRTYAYPSAEWRSTGDPETLPTLSNETDAQELEALAATEAPAEATNPPTAPPPTGAGGLAALLAAGGALWLLSGGES